MSEGATLHTTHTIHYKDARRLDELSDASIQMVVTSPPYPMIAMWDDVFVGMNPEIRDCLDASDGMAAFELMHAELDKVWAHVYRVLIQGGFACINIGDATRTIGGEFRLYPNHVRTLSSLSSLGFHVLPEIVWRKPTNSPTKFLGSGMLPCGAYVTLEHEMILILRKPSKRDFEMEAEKANRWRSSYFWEERNRWFSDLWELNGMRQALNAKEIRKRSGAYPVELPLRLISMYSSKFDTVLDPFLGTATTTFAAIACCRNSIGYEIEPRFRQRHQAELLTTDFVNMANAITETRIRSHADFITDYRARGRKAAYHNENGFPVVTRQETSMSFERVRSVSVNAQDSYRVEYDPWT